MSELITLFLAFFKVGALMFGGGYAMLPLLTREIVENRGWATEEELLDYFAIAQCTPGVIAVNTATFIGHKKKGALGAAFATLGVVFAPMCLILLIAMALQNLWQNPLVNRIFIGVRVAVSALIVSAVIRLVRAGVKNWIGIILCVLSFALVAIWGQSPVLAVVGSAMAGLLYGRART